LALSNLTSEYLSSEEKNQLQEVSNKLIQVQAEATSLGSKLANCVAKGVAFHHAGLSNAQRSLIEQNFKNHLIKCIVATPTLAWGVNLPARRVVVRDLWRYEHGLGASPLSVLEVLQMMGRAGRPQYDSYGEAILIAKNEVERFKILENYLLGESENITSKLGNESALRTHLLASIATGFAHDYEGLRDFLSKTFFAYQKRSIKGIEKLVDTIVKFLIENELVIEREEKLLATKFGKRVSELYIDPLSGIVFRDALNKARTTKATDFSWLHTVCSTPDMPLVYPRGRDRWLDEELPLRENEILVKDLSYEFELAYLKTACLLNDWTSECTEEYISSKYDAGPGDIYSKTETSEWLLYSMRELAKLFNSSVMPKLSKLILRIRYGVKEELLELVALRGIGRIRARALFKAGFKGLRDLRKASIEALAQVEKIGLATARSVKEQVSRRQ
ncbi:MAG: helicase-related protein, partial [Candidatus Thermoplasmatota archaeon]